MKTEMIEEKTWEEFRKTGLLLFVNQFLHIFGWAIVIEEAQGVENRAFPAKTKFRGFDAETVTKAHADIEKYMREISQEPA